MFLKIVFGYASVALAVGIYKKIIVGKHINHLLRRHPDAPIRSELNIAGNSYAFASGAFWPAVVFGQLTGRENLLSQLKDIQIDINVDNERFSKKKGDDFFDRVDE